MAEFFDRLDDKHIAMIEKQPVSFVATAAQDARINPPPARGAAFDFDSRVRLPQARHQLQRAVRLRGVGDGQQAVMIPFDIVDVMGREDRADLAEQIFPHLRKRHVQHALLTALDQHFRDRLKVGPNDTGLHIMGEFTAPVAKARLAAALKQSGTGANPLSAYFADPQGGADGLVMGYAGWPEKVLAEGVRLLAAALAEA